MPGAAQDVSDQPPSDPNEPVITDPGLVLSGEPPVDLEGSAISLERIPVRDKSGNGLWIGYSRTREIFVVPIDPSFLEFVTVGARVTLHGTLRRAPGASQAKRIWALDRDSTRRIRRERLYIDAWSISYMN